MTQPKELQGSVTLDLSQAPKTPEDLVTFTATAKALQVIDDTSFAIATEMCNKEARWHSAVDAFYDDGRDLAHRSWKWFTTRIAKHKEDYKAREYLEPRMKKYRQDQERKKQEAAAKITREQEAKREAEAAETRRIQKEADDKAAALRKEGDLRAAKQAQQETAAKVQEIQQAAEMEIEAIPADTKPEGGPGESKPWEAVVTDPMLFIKAVAEGKFKLMHTMPVRTKVGGKFVTNDEEVPVLEINMSILNDMSKRMGGAGAPSGIEFVRGLTLRFSKSDYTVKPEEDGW